MKAPCASPSRRYFLRSVGATLALPTLHSLLPNALGGSPALGATASETATPNRMVAIGNLLGYQLPYLFPEKPGKNYQSTRLLKPLEALRDDFTLYSGLDHGVKGGHFAVHSFMTGVLTMDAKGRPDGNISLDQLAAESVAGRTRFPSLTVGSESGIHGGCQLSWTRSGVRVPPIPGPKELFERLFVGEPASQLAKVKDKHALQGSILDAMTGNAKTLQKRIDQEDKDKLDEYLTSVREVEKQLQLKEQWVEVPKPEAPFELPGNTNMVEDLPLLYDLMVLALQTDSTRIATLEIGGDFEPKHLGITNGYHTLSHHGKKQENIDQLLVLEEYQFRQFARFLGKLKAIEDGDGSLLDHTSVLFGSGMSNANSHSNSNLPIILAGGGFEHGEYKDVPMGHHKVPLCNLYLSVLNRFGVERDNFGTSTGTFL
ncbi:DUF1552 domain-containing protein [Verrucomicrobiales bacterium BCK34]|nr:DUF1552 domain-containing protein [Verrucomicrobiales bacterium BCK34]